MKFDRFFSRLARRIRASEVRELLSWAKKRKVISFGGGFPDPDLYPVDELAEIARDVILTYRDKALQYGTTEGLDELREELIKFMREHGVRVRGLDNIMITSGSQQAIDILGRIFIDPGDVIIVEKPTYLAAINAFNLRSPKYYGVPMDNNGMIIEALESTLKRIKRKGERVKFLYTVPTAQNPTGITMSEERRHRLIELAEEYDFLVIEDNPYSYILFEPVKYEHLKSLDKIGRVIHLSTLSKVLVPGLRIGWAIADEEIIRKMILAKQSLDICTSTLSQYVAYEAFKRGLINEQLTILPKFYRRKRDLMIKALKKYMPERTRWVKPIGGMFIFVRLPKIIDTRELLTEALDRGVGYIPGDSFFIDRSGRNTMRLNFSYPKVHEIEEGIRILGELFWEELNKYPLAKTIT